MSVSVIVPRAGDCPHRERAWEWVRSQLDGFEVIEGWGDVDRWRKAEAVADALDRATGDILIIHDADVWSDHLHEAIAAVESGKHEWASPHWTVRRLTERGTEQILAGERETAEVEEDHYAVLGGGIVVIRRESYERAPLDPRFVGWGGEDHAAAAMWKTLCGQVWKAQQPLWHLWHPPQERLNRKVGSEASDDLRGRYIGARCWPKRMRDLVEEGQCRSTGSSQRV